MMSSLDERNTRIARAVQGVLTSTKNSLEGTTTWLSLTDPQGRVTYEWASTSALRKRFARADLTEGTDLGQLTAGANGVGLALARRRPTIVRGQAHSDERFQDLACAAAPIQHPISGELLGAVNITCLLDEQNSHLKLALESTLGGIRSSLSKLARERHQRLLDAHLRVKASTHSGVITLDRSTMITDGSPSGLGLDREGLWQLIEEVGPSATEITLPSGLRAQIIPVVPPSTVDGCTLIFSRIDTARLAASLVDGGRAASAAPAVPTPSPLAAPPKSTVALLSPLELAEREVISAALRQFEGNKSDCADFLRISRGTLYERIRRYGL